MASNFEKVENKKKKGKKIKRKDVKDSRGRKKKFFVCRCLSLFVRSFVRSFVAVVCCFRRSAPVLASVDIYEGRIRNIIYGVGDGVRRAVLLPEMHEPQASGCERWKEGWRIPPGGGVACPRSSAKVWRPGPICRPQPQRVLLMGRPKSAQKVGTQIA